MYVMTMFDDFQPVRADNPPSQQQPRPIELADVFAAFPKLEAEFTDWPVVLGPSSILSEFAPPCMPSLNDTRRTSCERMGFNFIGFNAPGEDVVQAKLDMFCDWLSEPAQHNTLRRLELTFECPLFHQGKELVLHGAEETAEICDWDHPTLTHLHIQLKQKKKQGAAIMFSIAYATLYLPALKRLCVHGHTGLHRDTLHLYDIFAHILRPFSKLQDVDLTDVNQSMTAVGVLNFVRYTGEKWSLAHLRHLSIRLAVLDNEEAVIVSQFASILKRRCPSISVLKIKLEVSRSDGSVGLHPVQSFVCSRVCTVPSQVPCRFPHFKRIAEYWSAFFDACPTLAQLAVY